MKLTIKNVFRKARRALLTAVAMLSVASASAQTTVQTTFKVCPLFPRNLQESISTLTDRVPRERRRLPSTL